MQLQPLPQDPEDDPVGAGERPAGVLATDPTTMPAMRAGSPVAPLAQDRGETDWRLFNRVVDGAQAEAAATARLTGAPVSDDALNRIVDRHVRRWSGAPQPVPAPGDPGPAPPAVAMPGDDGPETAPGDAAVVGAQTDPAENAVVDVVEPARGEAMAAPASQAATEQPWVGEAGGLAGQAGFQRVADVHPSRPGQPWPSSPPAVGPDPMVARLAPLRPDNPQGYVIAPDGTVNRWRFDPAPGLSGHSTARLEPVSPGEKQAYVEWLVEAKANYRPGVASPEEQLERSMPQTLLTGRHGAAGAGPKQAKRAAAALEVFRNVANAPDAPNLARRYIVAAWLESQLDPTSLTGRYKGLFHFSQETFDEVNKGSAKRADILNLSDQIAAARKEDAKLEEFLGRPPTDQESYLYHNQGAYGAKQIMKRPNDSVYETLAPFYKGNPTNLQTAITHNLIDPDLIRNWRTITNAQFMAGQAEMLRRKEGEVLEQLGGRWPWQ